jgi:hypothetical protein
MSTLIRMFLSLLAVSLISASPVTMHSAAAQETLALESAQNSQPAPDNMSPEAARNHFLACPGGPSMQFPLGGKVTNPTTFDLNKLQTPLYHTTVWAFYRAGASFETGEWTGVLLYDLLTQAQIILNPGVKNDLNRKVILVTGSDCYQQAFTMGELAPAIGGQHQVIVAFAKDGALLTDTGFARIINPGDKSGARNVSNIIRIQVFDPPLPKQDPNP